MHFFLFITSIIYGLIVNIRNFFFDYGILKVQTHNVPIICIGNISMGGSGKTPHLNYIAKLLSQKYYPAIISRGYGRKSSGFHYVHLDSTTSLVGDEPLQLKINNPDCIVAVNNNRNYAVNRIIRDHAQINLILLDDGFQHRSLKAGLNIILTPYYNLYSNDKLFPLGKLREPATGADRAKIIIISKTPEQTPSIQKKIITKALNIKAYQSVYFSSIKYYKFRHLKNNSELENEEEYSITLVCGIQNPTPLIDYLKEKRRKINLIKFADHHNYTPKDIKNILLEHKKDKSTKKLILTTEKDATKLRQILDKFYGIDVYYIPIEISINDKNMFKNSIIKYVTNY